MVIVILFRWSFQGRIRTMGGFLFAEVACAFSLASLQ